MIRIATVAGIKSILSALIASIIFQILKKLSPNINGKELNDIVSYSSCLIAASRAIETESKSPLINDPLALILAGTKAMSDKRKKITQKEGVSRIAIRTKYFDDYILNLLKRGKVKQVVLLGAGMDSRAFRFPYYNDDVTFYEIDNLNVLRLKEKKLQESLSTKQSKSNQQLILENMILQGNKRRKVISCNIENENGHGWSQPLLQSGYNPNLSTIWVLEGLTYYISSEEIMSRIFKTMHDLSSKKSYFIASIATLESMNRAKHNSSNKLLQSWKWGTDDPTLFLSSNQCGSWTVDDIVLFGGKKANYGRYKVDNSDDNTKKKSGIMYVTGKC